MQRRRVRTIYVLNNQNNILLLNVILVTEALLWLHLTTWGFDFPCACLTSIQLPTDHFGNPYLVSREGSSVCSCRLDLSARLMRLRALNTVSLPALVYKAASS